MNHPTPTELLDRAAGRLPADRLAEVDRHLADCDACRRRADDLARTWSVLGRWPAAAADRDLWPGIRLRLVQANDDGGTLADEPAVAPVAKPAWTQVALKAAAAVVLAGLAGHLAGRWVVETRADRAASPDGPTLVARTMHLHELGAAYPAGLADALPTLMTQDETEDTP